MSRGEARLLGGEVIIEILSAEKPAARTAIALRGSVKVVQVRGHLRNAEAAVLALRWQFIEPANQPGFLITADHGGAGKRCHVSRERTTQVESTDLLRGNVCIRTDPEIVIRSKIGSAHV